MKKAFFYLTPLLLFLYLTLLVPVVFLDLEGAETIESFENFVY